MSAIGSSRILLQRSGGFGGRYFNIPITVGMAKIFRTVPNSDLYPFLERLQSEEKDPRTREYLGYCASGYRYDCMREKPVQVSYFDKRLQRKATVEVVDFEFWDDMGTLAPKRAQSEPNKAPQPTTTAVTPPAAQEARQP